MKRDDGEAREERRAEGMSRIISEVQNQNQKHQSGRLRGILQSHHFSNRHKAERVDEEIVMLCFRDEKNLTRTKPS